LRDSRTDLRGPGGEIPPGYLPITGASKQQRAISANVGYPEIPNGTGPTDRKKKTSATFNLNLQKQSNRLMPEKVETHQSGVKGNFYAPFVGEGKRATASSYPTERAWG
jgi:hypothetical protein